MRLYLDICCLNRPFDDHSQVRVRLEAEAVLTILQRVKAGDWTLLSSAALLFELEQNPNVRLRVRVQQYLSLARENAGVTPAAARHAAHLRATAGLGKLDALHLACANQLRANVFLTTDDRLLRAAKRLAATELPFAVSNPLVWLTAFLEES